MSFITDVITANAPDFSSYVASARDSTIEKMEQLRSAIISEWHEIEPKVVKWGPAVLGGACFTYMFPYTVGVAVLSTCLIYYYSDFQSE